MSQPDRELVLGEALWANARLWRKRRAFWPRFALQSLPTETRFQWATGDRERHTDLCPSSRQVASLMLGGSQPRSHQAVLRADREQPTSSVQKRRSRPSILDGIRWEGEGSPEAARLGSAAATLGRRERPRRTSRRSCLAEIKNPAYERRCKHHAGTVLVVFNIPEDIRRGGVELGAH